MGIVTNNRRVNRNKIRLKSEINVTPFVDVMLVLLIIFMVCSPMLVAGIQVDLPETKASSLAGQDEPITITISKDGYIYIQDARVQLSTLPKKLTAVLKEKADTRIFVRGDKNISYGKVMEVFGIIKSSGFKNIALVTEGIDKKS